jgi:predicted site-specific integrase-resolvase
MADPNDLVTLTEAGRIAGVDRRTIERWCAEGRLQRIEIGGHPFVSRAELAQTPRRRPGRHPKAAQ